MQILIEIVHPADVLFFLRPIRLLEARGHSVDVVSRDKDVTCDLLDGFGIGHTPISRQGSGLVGLGLELLRRDAVLVRRFLRNRPAVTLGFGGVAVSHASRLLGIPSLVVYDSENASLQTRLAYPFLTHLMVPEDYAGRVPGGRTERVPGIKELSYFHPEAFRPDRDAALAAGLDPDRGNVFLRTVKWAANHDLGKAGWTEEQAAALVAALAPRAKLHVSAEIEPPAPLRPHVWRGDPRMAHHLLAHCDVYVGESATMACEAATLGVPAIYAGVDLPGYVAGMDRRGLVRWIPPGRRSELVPTARALLEDSGGFRTRRSAWLSRVPDWADVLADRAEALADRASVAAAAGSG